MQNETTMQRTLTNRTCLLGDSMAREVIHHDDNFETDQIGVVERPVSNGAYRRSRHPPARGTGSNPVTKIRALVDTVNLIQPTAAQIMPIRRHDCEFEGEALVKRRNLNL